MKKVNIELTEKEINEIRKALFVASHELSYSEDEKRYDFVNDLYDKIADIQDKLEEEE